MFFINKEFHRYIKTTFSFPFNDLTVTKRNMSSDNAKIEEWMNQSPLTIIDIENGLYPLFTLDPEIIDNKLQISAFTADPSYRDHPTIRKNGECFSFSADELPKSVTTKEYYEYLGDQASQWDDAQLERNDFPESDDENSVGDRSDVECWYGNQYIVWCVEEYFKEMNDVEIAKNERNILMDVLRNNPHVEDIDNVAVLYTRDTHP